MSETLKKYYPFKSDKVGKKYYIITNDNKKVYFAAEQSSKPPTGPISTS